ncbi:hypothetical protein BH11CYA1_BH11CYA1_45490 [soil metagenome]
MNEPSENNKSESKPSRLSKEQVIWLNGLVLALIVGRIGMGDYIISNEKLENFAMAIWALLFLCIAVIVSLGPKSRTRTISLVLAVPMAVLGSIGSCSLAAQFDEYPDQVELVTKASDVTFQLVKEFDVSYDGICRQFIELRMERPVFNSLLKKQERLISVQPADTAEAKVIDGGKHIFFSSPALLGRKAIERTYSTQWEEARKNGNEVIVLTKAEQQCR